jgi:uncharacterized protein
MPLTALSLTSGHAGHEVQTLGVCEALGVTPDIFYVSPSTLQSLIAPRGLPSLPPPLQKPYDIVIAASRQAVPFARAYKRAYPNSVVCVLQDPKISPHHFDLVWVSAHDKLRGQNVLVTLSSPHRLTHEKLALEALKLPVLTGEKIGVLVGGNSKIHRFNVQDARLLAQNLKIYASKHNASLYITPSRRTGAPQIKAMQEELAGVSHFMWDMQIGENPYFGILGIADKLIVTADSTNMLCEAAFTGKPVFAYPLQGKSHKFAQFHADLESSGAMRWFDGQLQSYVYKPLDSTQEIADKIRTILKR